MLPVNYEGTLTAYEVRHFLQPVAIKANDEIALLNEYLIGEIEKAMIKQPDQMKDHLISLYQYVHTKPQVH
jgi:hypothetical protein